MAATTALMRRTTSRVNIILQEPTPPGQTNTGGRAELLASARALLDRKATAAGNTGAFFPLLLNSSGVMPMIIASAAFYGILPKAAEFVGLIGVANFIYGLQATAWGLLVYGLLVFAMEFLPFGAVNPPEVAEYFTMVGAAILLVCVVEGLLSVVSLVEGSWAYYSNGWRK